MFLNHLINFLEKSLTKIITFDIFVKLFSKKFIKWNNKLVWKTTTGPYPHENGKLFGSKYEVLGPWPSHSDIEYFSKCFREFKKDPSFWRIHPHNSIVHRDHHYGMNNI